MADHCKRLYIKTMSHMVMLHMVSTNNTNFTFTMTYIVKFFCEFINSKGTNKIICYILIGGRATYKWYTYKEKINECKTKI